MKKTEMTFLEKTIRFLKPISKHKFITLIFIIYFILEGFFGVLLVFFVKDITYSLETGTLELFNGIIKNYLILFGFLFFLLAIFYKSWAYSYNRYREYIEEIYLPKYIKFDVNAYEKYGTGKSIAIISKGIKMWSTLLDNVLIHAVGIILSVSLTTYFLIQIHFALVFLLIGLIILGQSLGIYLNIKTADIRKERIILDNIWSKDMVKIIMAKMEILQANKTDQEIARLKDLHEGQIYYKSKMALYLTPYFSVGTVIVLILLLGFFKYFADLYYGGQISLAYITGVTGAILMMQKEFINMLDFLKNFGREFSEVQIMWNFFDETPEMQGYHTGGEFSIKKGNIELEKITYGYTEKQNIFDNFDLNIQGGKVTALVGPSGGGKSTLIKLIAGYIHSSTGNIIIDKQKLSDVSLKSYYKNIGYLTQEPSVFDGSIRENLSYALESEIDEAEMKKVLDLAQCQFVYDLEQGLDTEIGERGVRLSGGQKQRLAIAKIFLKNPKIILLDEPTSALDSISEKHISLAMHNLFENRTVIVIAHRLQTVKHADEIIYIENGTIAERGNHKELVKQKGLYNEMLELQSGF